jgi:hypothetical protein
MALTCDDSMIYTLDLPPGEEPALATTSIDSLQATMHEGTRRYVWEDTDIAREIHPPFGDSASFDCSSTMDGSLPFSMAPILTNMCVPTR